MPPRRKPTLRAASPLAKGGTKSAAGKVSRSRRAVSSSSTTLTTPIRSSPRKDLPSPSETVADRTTRVSSARRSLRQIPEGPCDEDEVPAEWSGSKKATRARTKKGNSDKDELQAEPSPSKKAACAGRDGPTKKGTSYRTPELACGYPRGRARILLQMLDEIEEEPSPSVAAAASTLLYSKACIWWVVR